MKFDSKKLKAFHEELTGIPMINWALQTSRTEERIGQIIPNALSMKLLNLPIKFVYIQEWISFSYLHISFNTILKTECYTFVYNTMYSFAYLYSKR